MKTVNEVVTAVESLLANGNGAARAARVINYLERLIALDADDEKARPRIKMRVGIVFFATVGNLLKSPVTLDVRINGRLVGKVQLRKDGTRPFEPVSPWKETWIGEQVDWGDPRVLRFLRQLAEKLPPSGAEASVQSALFLAMREGKGSKKLQVLHRNQPVQMLGLPFQFPVPISASGSEPKVSEGSALGHTDVLARGAGGHRLKVFEIKKGGKGAQALAQGVAYAAALRCLFRMSPDVMFKALGYPKPRTAFPKFEVWAFVEGKDVEAALKTGRSLQESNDHFDLHVMPYRMTGSGQLQIDDPIPVRLAEGRTEL